MVNLKNTILIFALLIIAVLNIFIYINFHIYYQAKSADDNLAKIKILKKSPNLFPSNDLVYFEEGNAYFNLALDNLGRISLAKDYLLKSINSFNRSLRINPASYFAHFNLAQSLLNLNYLQPSLPPTFYDEYKKAAELAGENSQIYFEVAKIFLSQWPRLPDKDKALAVNILRKIISKRDRQKFRSLLFLWEMNLKDYSLIEKIMPEDLTIYRIYAEYLGEKSLSLEERQKYLAKAELLSYQKARQNYEKSQYQLAFLSPQQALNHFKTCLNTLKSIKFYQRLTGQNLIGPTEFMEFKKSVLLDKIKFLLEQGRSLTEIKDSLLEYLSLEDTESAIADFESYLKLRHIISAEIEPDFKNLDLLYIKLLLSYKQSRFRNIITIGRQLQQSFVVVPGDKQDIYGKILQIVGDAFQKVDFIYDAHDFYQKALEINPDDLNSLIKMRGNYLKLNSEEKIKEIDRKIDSLIAPKFRKYNNRSIDKGQVLSSKLIFDGQDKLIELHFDWDQRGNNPLISVFFNGKIVWENYLTQNTLSLPVATKIGKNLLEITAVNRPVILTSISWRKK